MSSMVHCPPSTTFVHALDHDTVWVTGSFNSTGLILKTTDAGLTWSRQGGDDGDDAARCTTPLGYFRG